MSFLQKTINEVSQQIYNSLPEFCQELIDFSDTGILTNDGPAGTGYVRGVISTLVSAGMDNPSARSLVINMVHRHSMEFVLAANKQTDETLL